MKHTWSIAVVAASVLALQSCTEKKIIPPVTAAEVIIDKNWQFETTPAWQDNFDGTAVDNSKWTFETGGGGWGNNELQFYTQGPNARLDNGRLVIEARRENVGGREYSSTRMITKGKGDWLYGRFEIRAKLPRGRGTWPAVWMLSSDNSYGVWPASGEIDIMEHVGYDPERIHCSIHTSAYNHMRNTQRTSSRMVPGVMDDFHVYRVDWTPYAVRGFVDGVQYFEFVNENKGFTVWPFNRKFFLILNIAIGGNWGGAQGVDNSIFPTRMEVDYVRVFRMIEQ
ncbi:MAG: glycoside hydrolase family 16 protein [Chitinophagaceae bacterium]|jgi:beta-glucanase (GH16 family)|nr:glycoside hydrolase family 16 protein [Chitinophagaceae bacterium]